MRCNNNCYVPSNMLFSNVYIREVIKEEIISVSDTLKGDSAYEVAVKLGYKGNEEEWLSEQGATIEQINVNTGEAGTDASVVLNGTPKNRIIDLTIPKGDKGIQGIQGEKGNKGDPGRDGSFTQKAYKTYAGMVADKDNIPIDTSVVVNNDPDKSNNAFYTYDGTEFTKSDFDPQGILTTVDVRLNQAVQSASDYFQSQVADTISTSIDNSTVAYTEAINTTKTQVVADAKAATKSALDTAVTVLFENGGLPATPFATKALMTASVLIDGDYAMVTDETANNGLYVKTAGAWVKSGYDPLTQANTYTDKAAADAVSETIEYNLTAGKDLEIAVDNKGLAYRRVDSTGKEFLAHLDRSVQDEFSVRSSGIAVTAYAGDIEQLLDADNNVVSRTDKRGGFYIASGGSSVQHFLREAIADPYKKSDFNAPIKNPRETYSAEIKALVANLQQECLPYIEPPLLLVPNNLNIPDSVLSVITTSDDNSVGQLQFPNTLGGSVHPYALQLRKPLYGYKGLLLDSNHKYGSEGDENPVMFGTNDWNKFELVPDVQQPMWHPAVGEEGRERDSFLSDPWFAYDPTDGGLIWGTRESYKYDTKETYFIMTKTYDGVRWTERKKVLNATQVTGNSDKSPAMLYNPIDGLWHLWTVVNEGSITHYTSNNYLGNWTEVSTHNFNTSHNFAIWHIEVKFVGSKYALCGSSKGDNSQVYLGFSDDGNTWVLSKGIVEPQSKGIYKPTFNVEFRDDGSYRFVFIWAHWNFGAPNWNRGDTQQLYVQPTQWLNA